MPTARIVIHPLDESGIVQSKQNRINPVHHLLHEFPHLVIANARQPVPRYLAIGRYDLCIRKIPGLRVRLNTGVTTRVASASTTISPTHLEAREHEAFGAVWTTAGDVRRSVEGDLPVARIRSDQIDRDTNVRSCG
jgi:hypothetical protein